MALSLQVPRAPNVLFDKFCYDESFWLKLRYVVTIRVITHIILNL